MTQKNVTILDLTLILKPFTMINVEEMTLRRFYYGKW